MEKFIVNSEVDRRGYHEVHRLTCNHLPSPIHCEDLGYCTDEYEALYKAKQYRYEHSDGCYYCCELIHNH